MCQACQKGQTAGHAVKTLTLKGRPYQRLWKYGFRCAGCYLPQTLKPKAAKPRPYNFPNDKGACWAVTCFLHCAWSCQKRLQHWHMQMVQIHLYITWSVPILHCCRDPSYQGHSITTSIAHDKDKHAFSYSDKHGERLAKMLMPVVSVCTWPLATDLAEISRCKMLWFMLS